MSFSNRPPEPWDSFFKELDEAVDTTVRLDCIGGFVVTLLYGLTRPTQERYATELRWQLGVPKREDLTMQLWLEAIREDRE